MNTQQVINIIKSIQSIEHSNVVEIIPTSMVLNHNVGFFCKIDKVNVKLNELRRDLTSQSIYFSFDERFIESDLSIIIRIN